MLPKTVKNIFRTMGGAGDALLQNFQGNIAQSTSSSPAVQVDGGNDEAGASAAY